MVAGGLGRDVTQPDNGLATSGPPQWHTLENDMTDPCEVHAQESQRLQPDRLTLTDEEREAIADAIRRLWGFDCAPALRGLLERTAVDK
jgi:hypothetical protein